MHKFIVTICTAWLALWPLVAAAQTVNQPPRFFTSQTQVIIRYQKINWQTYEFYAAANTPDADIQHYQWTIDGKVSYDTPRIRVYFDQGEHQVLLIVQDYFGNRQYDMVKLNIQFWSLHNNTLWWFVYGFVALIIFYYWVVKLIYLFNRYKIKRRTRAFLDVLDTHGYVEQVVGAIVSKKLKKNNLQK